MLELQTTLRADVRLSSDALHEPYLTYTRYLHFSVACIDYLCIYLSALHLGLVTVIVRTDYFCIFHELLAKILCISRMNPVCTEKPAAASHGDICVI